MTDGKSVPSSSVASGSEPRFHKRGYGGGPPALTGLAGERGIGRRLRDAGLALVAVFLTAGQVDDRQDADGVEDGDADEPGELVVARALPHADGFPHAVPDRDEDEERDQQAEPDGKVVRVNVSHGDEVGPKRGGVNLEPAVGRQRSATASHQHQADNGRRQNVGTQDNQAHRRWQWQQEEADNAAGDQEERNDQRKRIHVAMLLTGALPEDKSGVTGSGGQLRAGLRVDQ